MAREWVIAAGPCRTRRTSYLIAEERGSAGTECGGLPSFKVAGSPQYGVAGLARNPFKLCDFVLVTPTTLLY